MPVDTRAKYRTTYCGDAQTEPMARIMCYAACYRRRLLWSLRLRMKRTEGAQPLAGRTILQCHRQTISNKPRGGGA